jgi:acetyl esterase/lipase
MIPVYVSLRGLDVKTGIGPESPPTFLVGASDDKVTVPSNSLDLYEALIEVGVPVELDLYERGGHGFGLAKSKGPLASWSLRCEDRLRLRELNE